MAKKEPPNRAVLVATEDSAPIRQYLRQVQIGEEHLPVVLRADEAREIVAAFIDTRDQNIVSVMRSKNIPIVFGLQSALANLNSSSSPERLHILLPGYASDVVAACSVIDDDNIGCPVFLEVNIYVGETLSDPRWEPDNLCALTNLEGIAYGVQLARLLVGQRYRNTDTSDVQFTEGQQAHVGTWSYKIGPVVVVQNIFTGPVASVPLFSVNVIGTIGRLSLRQEFSPGVLTIWSNSERMYRCPAISRLKDNIQAPDSWPCGEEFHLAIESAMESGDKHGLSFLSKINLLVLEDTKRFLGISSKHS